jgi:spoIIIJ-associated protein
MDRIPVPERNSQVSDTEPATAEPGDATFSADPADPEAPEPTQRTDGAGSTDGHRPSGDTDDESEDLLVREGDIAADYLERLLDIADYDGDIDLDVENDRAIVAIVGSDLSDLVGTHGETLDALQELTRLAVQQKTGVRSRLMLDISGHRQARRAELTALASDTATRVLSSGEPARLTPMNPFERKVVHDAIAAISGVHSESEGEEPNRRVVVLAGE